MVWEMGIPAWFGPKGPFAAVVPDAKVKHCSNPGIQPESGIRMRDFSLVSSFILASVLCLPLAGCAKKSKPTGPVSAAPPVATSVGAPLTEDDYREFGRQLQMAVASGNLDEANRLYHLDSLAERCVSDLNLSADTRKGFLEGFKKSVKNQGGFANQLIEGTKAGGSFTALPVRTVGGRPSLIMRIILPNGGINYQDFSLVRFPDGSIGPEDFHVMVTGEKVSQTFRRMIIKIVADVDKSLMARLTGAERTFINNLPKMQSITQAIKQGRFKDAIATYRTLPTEIQDEKVCLIPMLTAAAQVDEEEYIRLIERFRKVYPDDPAVGVMSIDYYILKKEYDKSLQSLARLNKAVGGDPYLLMLQGSTLVEAGRAAQGKAEIEKAAEMEPTLEAAYQARIGIAIKEKNHSDTLVWLKKLVEKCGFSINEESLKSDPANADFLKSPQFQEFLKWNKARGM